MPDTLKTLFKRIQEGMEGLAGAVIGDRAERHQIEIVRHIGGANALTLIPAALTQVGVEGRHQIEGHPDPGSERLNHAPLPTGQLRPVGRNGSRVVVRARLARRL